MVSNFINVIRTILGVENYDRRGEQLIKKSIVLWHRGGYINQFRAKRLHNYVRTKYSCCFYPKGSFGEGLYIAHAHNIFIAINEQI